MKKIVFTVLALMLVLSTVAFSQWTEVRSYSPFKEVLKPDNLWGLHGLAVDPEGKIWVAGYNGTDTVTIGSGTNDKRREIFVFNPNGTKTSFSPIKVIEAGGIIDSLNHNNSPRGLTADEQGNILYSSWDRIFRLNYKTGAGMNRVSVWADAAGNNGISIDSAGNIFVGQVVGAGSAYKIYDKSFNFIGNAIDAKPSIICRTTLVSADGNTLYIPNIYAAAQKYVYVYQTSLGPGLGQYTKVDSILSGMQVESMAWQPRKNTNPILWVSAGSRENPPDSMWTIRTWYGYNVQQKKVVDSIKWGVTFPGNPTYDDTVANGQAARPRGIAFTASGDTAYVGSFLADSNSVKMFKKTGTGVRREGYIVASTYALSQNYPNPFNPSTEIKFTLSNGGYTTLRVYDVLGREVSTLVNERLNSGAFSVTFDARNIPSGTYLYTLNVDGRQISKKMMLLK